MIGNKMEAPDNDKYIKNQLQREGKEIEADDPIYRLTRPKTSDYRTLVQVPLFILYPLLAIFFFASSCALSSDQPHISWPAGFLAAAAAYYFQVVLREYWGWMQKKAILFGLLKTKEYWIIIRKPSNEVLWNENRFHIQMRELNQQKKY